MEDEAGAVSVVIIGGEKVLQKDAESAEKKVPACCLCDLCDLLFSFHVALTSSVCLRASSSSSHFGQKACSPVR